MDSYNLIFDFIEQQIAVVNDVPYLCSLIKQMETIQIKLGYIHEIQLDDCRIFNPVGYFIDNMDYIIELPLYIQLYKSVLMNDSILFEKKFNSISIYNDTNTIAFFWKAICYKLSVNLVKNYYNLTKDHPNKLCIKIQKNGYYLEMYTYMLKFTIHNITYDTNISPPEYDLFIRFLFRESRLLQSNYIIENIPTCNEKSKYAFIFLNEIIHELSRFNNDKVKCIENIKIPDL
jgi:hypothetical protein